MDQEATGRRIKAARQLVRLTVPQLAKRLDLPGLGEKTLGSIERGERALRPQEVAPLARALEVPEAFLVGENPAGQPAADVLARRLNAIEQALLDAREERDQHAATIEGLLKRQDDVLEAIEKSIRREDEARSESQEATRALLAAVEVANRALLAESPETAEAPEPPAR